MKHLFTIIIALILSIGAFAQIEFAPLGAKWTYKSYSQGSFGFGIEGIKHIEVVADSLNDGIRYLTLEEKLQCQNFSYNNFAGEWQYSNRTSNTKSHHLKVTQDTVYFLNPVFGRYTPLYVFNVAVGDTVRIPITDTNGNFYCDRPFGDFGFDVNTNSNGDSIITFVVDSIVNKNYNGTVLETYYVTNPLDMETSNWPFYQPLAPQINWFSKIYYEHINSNLVTRVSGAYTSLLGGLASGILPTRYGNITITDQIYNVFSLCRYEDSSQTINFSSDIECDSFQIRNPLSIKSATQSDQLKIYPNPTENTLHIDLTNPGKDWNIKIVNLLGRAVISNQEINQQKNNIDVSALNAGVYLMIISLDGESYYHKFVKQ